MSTLRDLDTDERNALARKIAVVWLDSLFEPEDTRHDLAKRAHKVLADSDLVHEKNFYGEGFNEEQAQELESFRVLWLKAHEHADLYDKCNAPVREAAPGFALPSTTLRRSYCAAQMMRALAKPESPFGSLLVADPIDDGGSSSSEAMASSEEDEEEDEEGEEGDTSEEEAESSEYSSSSSESEEEEEAELAQAKKRRKAQLKAMKEEEENAPQNGSPEPKRTRCPTPDLAPDASPLHECVSDDD